jgi:hypothetical protein
MLESQSQIYKDIQNALNQDLHDVKTQTLITLAYTILSGYKYPIESYVKRAIGYGATRRDFLNVISCIIGDKRLLCSIMELFRILDENFQMEGE